MVGNSPPHQLSSNTSVAHASRSASTPRSVACGRIRGGGSAGVVQTTIAAAEAGGNRPMWERRPPLWLAAAAVAGGWAALYSIGRWLLLFALGPVHEDVLMYYAAAQVGIRHGWSAIYNQSLCGHDRPATAGVVLAVATFLKPQALLLLPVALMFSGRIRAVAGWAAGCGALGVATVITLGPSGLSAWETALKEVQGLPVDTEYTLTHLLGTGLATYMLWGRQGAVAVGIAWALRVRRQIVVAAGLLGTAATASYFH